MQHKKRTIISLVMVGLLMTSSLIGCGEQEECRRAGNIYPIEESVLEYGHLKKIEGKEYLVYSIDTKIVYYMYMKMEVQSDLVFFEQYISENGNYCRYVDGEIVEITANN